MTQKEYNGWTNYETWVVNLWMDNDEGSQNYWNGRAQEIYNEAEASDYSTREQNAVRDLADEMKTQHDDTECDLLEAANLSSSVWADLLNAALSEVNWYEIAEHYIENVDKEVEA